MASLYDVAALAGVSKTLVSRVINQKKGVGEGSRARILAAMKQLNYTPNELARSLVLQKTHTVGVVLDSLCEPYFFDLIRGIESAIATSAYSVIFCSGGDRPAVKNKYIQFFSQGRTDGVIIYGSNLGDQELIKNLAQSQFPSVVVENEVEGVRINNVVVDNAFGSGLAVDHLLRCSCREICHVTGDLSVKAAVDRRDGYIAAMARHELPVSSEMILRADFTVRSGYDAVRDFLSGHTRQQIPDAFYFGADSTAFGGMMALEDAGLCIPRDVQVVGFDNDTPRVMDRPLKKLTTLSQPLHEIGAAAVAILIGSIEDRQAPPQKISFYPELLVRETTRDEQ